MSNNPTFKRASLATNGMENMFRSLFGSCISGGVEHVMSTKSRQAPHYQQPKSGPHTGMIIDTTTNMNRARAKSPPPPPLRKNRDSTAVVRNKVYNEVETYQPYKETTVLRFDHEDDAMSEITQLTLEEMEAIKSRRRGMMKLAENLIEEAKHQRKARASAIESSDSASEFDSLWKPSAIEPSSRFEPRPSPDPFFEAKETSKVQQPKFSHSSPITPLPPSPREVSRYFPLWYLCTSLSLLLHILSLHYIILLFLGKPCIKIFEKKEFYEIINEIS